MRGRQSAALLVVSGRPATEEDDGVRMDLRVDDSADPVAQLRMLRNLQRAYDEGDYETLALFAPAGARELYTALAATRRDDREAARTALEALRGRPGWAHWLASMAADGRLSGVSGCSTTIERGLLRPVGRRGTGLQVPPRLPTYGAQ